MDFLHFFLSFSISMNIKRRDFYSLTLDTQQIMDSLYPYPPPYSPVFPSPSFFSSFLFLPIPVTSITMTSIKSSRGCSNLDTLLNSYMSQFSYLKLKIIIVPTLQNYHEVQMTQYTPVLRTLPSTQQVCYQFAIIITFIITTNASTNPIPYFNNLRIHNMCARHDSNCFLYYLFNPHKSFV